jgi:hypothetical protein
MCGDDIPARIEHLRQSTRAVVSILLLRPGVVDHRPGLISRRVIFESGGIDSVVGRVEAEALKPIKRNLMPEFKAMKEKMKEASEPDGEMKPAKPVLILHAGSYRE